MTRVRRHCSPAPTSPPVPAFTRFPKDFYLLSLGRPEGGHRGYLWIPILGNILAVVLKTEMTAFLQAPRQRGCRVQVGSDMLFEQIPAYLEYFGFASTTAEELRRLARISY